MIEYSQRIMEDTPVSSLIQQFLRNNHREDDFLAHTAVEIYQLLIPEELRPGISKVSCVNDKLYVETTNASLRFELMNMRSDHVAQINADLGKNVISDIVFR